ncbi:ParB/RepB/Spo0J family partition protein [Rhizobium leguminosarum]|uniref:ParB/RepB/Spo0J family partition protein n=1 Tax=Rhizobium leguminosarum TaxID=384 RepID=UPI0013BA6796|nr:ParB/RepB/Spo0J family partition protein [Rhizobium leguminosarum]NEH72300.1 ParB/RepB/Spo0J family partition protein [Rhizobium leguminosarum]
MEQLSLTTDRLVLDPNNARRMRDKDSLASLKASILAHGIIQPITVRPPAAADRDLEGDRYRVFAGGRRLSAVTELIFEGKLPVGYEMPVLMKDVDDSSADEMSLAENILRRNMRPVDEFKAFSRLAEEGATADDIALRFGQTLRFIQGRMALGRLHPVLLEMLDLDEIRLETAMAYTLEPDPERQLEIYNNLQGWQKTNSTYIKEAIAGSGTKSNGPVGKFIGETRYITAGGKITHDLFEDHSFWVSSDVVEKLRAERIAEIKAELLAAGWAWVKTADELGNDVWYMDTLRPEETGLPPEQQARLSELEAYFEEFEEPDEGEDADDYEQLQEELQELNKLAKGVHSTEQRAKSGVVIRTDSDYRMDYGKLPRGTAASSSSSDKADKDKDPLALSAPTLSELGKAATAALAQAVEAQPDKALALLAALLELAPTSPWQQHRPGRLNVVAPGVTAGNSTYGLSAKRSFTEAFEEYAAMKAADLKKALAQLAAGAVDISQEWLPKNPDMRIATLEAFGVDPTPHFDVDSFFSAGRKPIIAAAYKEMTGQDLKDGKKADMVAIAVDSAKKTGWLPEYLRTASYKPKKAK